MKKERMVGARLPESLMADLERIEQIEQTDMSTRVRKLLSQTVADWKLEYYAREYWRGSLTLARAAEEAGVSLWEMIDYVRQKKIPAQYSLEDLEHDLEVVSQSISQGPS